MRSRDPRGAPQAANIYAAASDRTADGKFRRRFRRIISPMKVFVVKFRIGDDNDFNISKAFAGRLSAQQYVESEAKRLLKDEYDPGRGRWTDAWNYRYENAMRCKDREGKEHLYDYSFEIEEVDVEQNVVLPELPAVEKESLALKQENRDLRKKLGHAEGLIAAAKCYLTMWDGGWEYDREHILENMHAARFILEDGEPGNRKIQEMFEGWLRAGEGRERE